MIRFTAHDRFAVGATPATSCSFANIVLSVILSLGLVIMCSLGARAESNANFVPQNTGTDSMNTIRQQFFDSQYGKYISYAKPVQWGGHAQYDPKTGKPTPGFVQGAYLTANNGIPMYTNYPPTPMGAFFNFPTDTTAEQWRYYTNMMPSTGGVISDTAYQAYTTKVFHDTVGNLTDPGRLTPAAMSIQQAQASSAANALGDVARSQASSAIDFSSKYLFNFTTDGGNVWNRIRNQLFVPIGILLLLPGAIMSQVKAIMNAGNPAMDDPLLGAANPFDGILRALIAIFLIPASYLIVNYGIDVSNSITLTIAGAYSQMFGGNMYKAAECAQIRANPVRQAAENNNNYSATTANMYPLLNSKTTRGNFEGNTLETKIEDPCSGISIAPADRTDEAMSFGNTATRLLANGMNAGLTTTWNLLSAFMMAYLMYLFFVGPVVAALYAWPMLQLRNAFPSWVEGTITICFWSLFWNTVILMMACFKGVDETGTLIMTALNFLATASVQYAFDFASLVKAAGQQAGQQAASKAKAAGGKGSAGATGARGAQPKPAARPATIAATSAALKLTPASPSQPTSVNASFSFTPPSQSGGNAGSSDQPQGASDSFVLTSTSAMALTPASVVNASTPSGQNKAPLNVGLPPMIASQPVETYRLPNGETISISRNNDSGTAIIRDQNGSITGSYDTSGQGSNYYRLMNGDMLQIARDGNSDVLSLTSDGQTYTLQAGGMPPTLSTGESGTVETASSLNPLPVDQNSATSNQNLANANSSSDTTASYQTGVSQNVFVPESGAAFSSTYANSNFPSTPSTVSGLTGSSVSGLTGSSSVGTQQYAASLFRDGTQMDFSTNQPQSIQSPGEYYDSAISSSPFYARNTTEPFDSAITSSAFNARSATEPFDSAIASSAFNPLNGTDPFDSTIAAPGFNARNATEPFDSTIASSAFYARTPAEPLESAIVSSAFNALNGTELASPAAVNRVPSHSDILRNTAPEIAQFLGSSSGGGNPVLTSINLNETAGQPMLASTSAPQLSGASNRIDVNTYMMKQHVDDFSQHADDLNGNMQGVSSHEASTNAAMPHQDSNQPKAIELIDRRYVISQSNQLFSRNSSVAILSNIDNSAQTYSNNDYPGISLAAPSPREHKDTSHETVQNYWYDRTAADTPPSECTKCSTDSCHCQQTQKISRLSQILGSSRTRSLDDAVQKTVDLLGNEERLFDDLNTNGAKFARPDEPNPSDQNSADLPDALSTPSKCERCTGLLCSCMGMT
jgi:hypothetical protein